MKYLDLLLKENMIRQTSFLRKKLSQKPASFRVKTSIKMHWKFLKWLDIFFPWLRQLCYRRSFFDFLIYCWIESSWIMMLLWLRVIPGGMKCPAGELVVPLGTSARDIYFCSVVLLYDGKYGCFKLQNSIFLIWCYQFSSHLLLTIELLYVIV